MKCIKNFKTKRITRVQDRTAAKSVTLGVSEYCAKGEWKKQEKRGAYANL